MIVPILKKSKPNYRLSARLFLALLCYSAFISQAIADPSEIKFCTENEEDYPWLMKNGSGLDNILLKRVEEMVGIPVSIQILPWKRCMANLQAGISDGAFKVSYKADRLEFGLYPMLNGHADPEKRLQNESYSLYRRKGSNIDWDGTKFLNAHGAVGAQAGFSIVDRLKELGIKVDESSSSVSVNFDKLLLRRVEAVALKTLEGDHVLASTAEYAASLERVEPPLVDKPYYLMLSKQFVARYPELSNTIWNDVATARKSAEFQKILKDFR